MDLRNEQITVGELLNNPRSRALLYRELPGVMNHPMLGMARGMTLAQVLRHAGGRVPREKIHQVLTGLKAL